MDQPRLLPAGNGSRVKAAFLSHTVQEFRSVFGLPDRACRDGDSALCAPGKYKAAELVQATQTTCHIARIEPTRDQGGFPQLDHHPFPKHRLEGRGARDLRYQDVE
jgi:hypothetical protein